MLEERSCASFLIALPNGHLMQRVGKTDKRHLEWFFAKMDDIFMRSEVLRCPEALVAVGLFAYKRSVRLWQVRSHVSLQVGFTKIRLGTGRAYKRALIAKKIQLEYTEPIDMHYMTSMGPLMLFETGRFGI